MRPSDTEVDYLDIATVSGRRLLLVALAVGALVWVSSRRDPPPTNEIVFESGTATVVLTDAAGEQTSVELPLVRKSVWAPHSGVRLFFTSSDGWSAYIDGGLPDQVVVPSGPFFASVTSPTGVEYWGDTSEGCMLDAPATFRTTLALTLDCPEVTWESETYGVKGDFVSATYGATVSVPGG